MIYVSVLIQHHAGPTGDVLVCQRQDGVWVFPSTRVRTNETSEEAAARCALEQLNMTIKVGKMAMIGRKKPNDGYVEHLYEGNITHNTDTKCDYHEYYEAVNTWQAEPKGDTYIGYAWVHPSELGKITFIGDDANFMAKYDPWVNAEFIPERRMF